MSPPALTADQRRRLDALRTCNDLSNMRYHMRMLEDYTIAQAKRLISLEQQLRRLREIHRAHEFIRDTARWMKLDSVTLAYAFEEWLGQLDTTTLERLRRESAARKGRR